ncbi:MAG: hypothetical protein DMD33_17190 [Gemmatimonadetes bacterium]|nr:MAG: hypothetical protein DMD33_17190 [Gemmatimonadota bacterium]
MTRTILSAAVLIALAACSKGGSERASTRAARAGHPAATQSKTGTTAAPSQAQKKKGAAKPDTGRGKNPLTNN